MQPRESACSNLSDLGLSSQIENKALKTQVSLVYKLISITCFSSCVFGLKPQF